jgi:hypothetical protein
MSKARSIGSATLTSSFATIGAAVSLTGSWAESRSGGVITLRFKHTKHLSQSGGYPVIRVRGKTYNAAGTLIDTMDLQIDGNITASAGVAAVSTNEFEVKLEKLTDSDGSVQGSVTYRVPPYQDQILVQAKQAGDTTNLGTLAVEIDGEI